MEVVKYTADEVVNETNKEGGEMECQWSSRIGSEEYGFP
jgi:hypothetical protein